MNAAAKALSQGTLMNHQGFTLPKEAGSFMMLIAMILLSALAIVYVKDYNRRTFIELQNLQQQTQALQVEWSQLLLEESTLTSQVRVEAMASQSMGMHAPEPKSVMMVEE